MVQRFPIFKAGTVFNDFHFNDIDKNLHLKYRKIKIEYPCRMDAMAINPAAVCYNDKYLFTPGEVVISINRKIKVSISVVSDFGGHLEISKSTKRKVLVKHAFKIMSKALKVNPSLKIDVDSTEIMKHCGFGSSSSTISAVASAINELYGHPIENEDLIKYLASNHGEEVSDENEEDMKMVQCIGGGATSGLTKEGIIIIAGKATPIAKLNYTSDILIGIPNKFQTKSADELMRLEEDNLWKFKRTGDKYAEKIAYDLLHKALPDINNGNIKELAKVVFDYRFNMGSIENCSFVYEDMIKEAKALRKLYEHGNCEFLTLSSVGPAFVIMVKNKKQKKTCTDLMKQLDMNIIETDICNSTYKIVEAEKNEFFWKNEQTIKSFTDMKPSKYITDEIEEISKMYKVEKVIDVGCGGGRYVRYLKEKGYDVLAIDKYKEMAKSLKGNNFHFIQADMSNLPVKSNYYDLILSIGVLHNATSVKQFEKTIKEFNRILKNDCYIIMSVFTNDIITDDLTKIGENIYAAKERPEMVLMSKQDINQIIEKNGLYIDKLVDEHITNVGIGKRNVYTIRIKKSNV